MKFKAIVMLAFVAIVACPAVGQDEVAKKSAQGKKGAKDFLANSLIKKLEPVGLTDDQVNKIKEMGAKLQVEFTATREAAEITKAVEARLAAAQKSMKDSELKGKERLAAIHKAAGINEKQSEAFKKTSEIRGKLKKDVLALLTDAQKEKLPDGLKLAAKKKKKDAS